MRNIVIDYDRYLSEQKNLSIKKNAQFQRKCKNLSIKTGNNEFDISIKKRMKKFKHLFEYINIKKMIPKNSKVLSLGSRRGEEIMALRNFGYNAVGIDLIPFGDYVIEGDFHHLPFEDNSFSFIFSNSLDHAFDFSQIFDEIWRVLRKGSYCVLHLVIGEKHKNSKEIVSNIDNLSDLTEFLVGKFYIERSFRFIGSFAGGLNTLVILKVIK